METKIVPAVTPEEDQAWQEMEHKNKVDKLHKKRQLAVMRASEFCDEYRDQMEIFTVRKAFELGYMKGVADELGL